MYILGKYNDGIPEGSRLALDTSAWLKNQFFNNEGTSLIVLYVSYISNMWPRVTDTTARHQWLGGARLQRGDRQDQGPR